MNLFVAALAICTGTLLAQESAVVETVTSDGVTIYGQAYFGSLNEEAPLILLFHQGGSNARGEYAELAPWLNDAGFRALAWDLRAGGDVHGSENRTLGDLTSSTPKAFCDAYADLAAALEFASSRNPTTSIVLWGSSYSAALVFRLAAEHPERVSAVLAFSPASGGPMTECRARNWVDQVTAPVATFRPASEMGTESSIEQRRVLSEAGAQFFVIEDGVHGSSMLVDDRTGRDMSGARTTVIEWIEEQLNRETPSSQGRAHWRGTSRSSYDRLGVSIPRPSPERASVTTRSCPEPTQAEGTSVAP